MLARIGIGIGALIIAFVGAAFIVAGLDIADLPTCKDVNAGVELPVDGECYDGSDARQVLQTLLCVGAGAIGVLAIVPGLAYAFRRKWLRVFGLMVAVAVGLGILYAIAGRI